jgi:hypothetical protein
LRTWLSPPCPASESGGATSLQASPTASLRRGFFLSQHGTEAVMHRSALVGSERLAPPSKAGGFFVLEPSAARTVLAAAGVSLAPVRKGTCDRPRPGCVLPPWPARLVAAPLRRGFSSDVSDALRGRHREPICINAACPHQCRCRRWKYSSYLRDVTGSALYALVTSPTSNLPSTSWRVPK